MSPRYVSLILFSVGLMIMLTWWGDVVTWLGGRGELSRPIRVLEWSNSGSPHHELKLEEDFEALNPEINVIQRFSESGTVGEHVFIAFVSGNPPDIMQVSVAELRDMVVTGRLRAIDDLLERQLAEEPGFLDNLFDGQDAVYRFYANPDDPLFARDEQGRFLHPVEAARLVDMHGKAVGLTSSASFDALTYNRRVFRDAARWFTLQGETEKAAQLVNEQNEPLPPRTWAEFLDKAVLITEYGRRAYEAGELAQRVYGVVVQGQRARDVSRAVIPLASVAGTRGYDYRPQQSVEVGEASRTVGQFEYDHPAVLSALKVLLLLQANDCVLPGTSSRHFEDSRVELGRGSAAMIIDGWHVALIAAERVPWSRRDVGTAAIPVPWEDDAGRERLVDWMGEDLVSGLGGGIGARSAGGITAITARSQHPWEAWKWMTFRYQDVAQQRNARRGAMPGSRSAAENLDDPDWFPFPYQRQAWDVLNQTTAIWPQPPTLPPIAGTNHEDIFKTALEAVDARQPDRVNQVLADARSGLASFTDTTNRLLRSLVAERRLEPEMFTFEDWSPTNPQPFFRMQRDLGDRPEAREALASIRDQVPENLFTPEILKYRVAANPLQVLLIPAMIAMMVLMFFLLAGKSVLQQVRRNAFAYVFIAPAILAIFTFYIYPTFYQIYLSFYSGSGIGPLTYVGWDNYARLLDPSHERFDSIFWTRVLPNTGLYMILVVIGQIGLGLLLANLLNLPLKSNSIARPLFFIPLVTSLAAVSVIFLGLFAGPDSGLNGMLRMVGLGDLASWIGYAESGTTHDWLRGDPTHILPSDLLMTILVAIWHGLPYNIILLLAGLQSIDPQLYEAAKVDGAGPSRRFIHITIPELTPILVVIVFNALISAARAFGVVYVLTEGGNNHSSDIVATYIFKTAFRKTDTVMPDIGYASAMGIIYAAILALLTFTNVYIIAKRWRQRLANERMAGGRPEAKPPADQPPVTPTPLAPTGQPAAPASLHNQADDPQSPEQEPGKRD